MRISALISVLLLPLLFSCGESKVEAPAVNYFAVLMGENGGHMRGVEIGDSAEDVLAAEGVEPKDREGNSYLTFRHIVHNEDFIAVTYSLDEDGVYEIQAELDLHNKEDAPKLYEALKKHFTATYGQPHETLDSEMHWLLSNAHSNEIELSLFNESDRYEIGKIAVTFYDFELELELE